MYEYPIPIEQVIQCADGEEVHPLTLEGLLHMLRTHGRVEIRGKDLAVPTATELAIQTIRSAGGQVTVSGPELEVMNQAMKDALV